MPGLIRLLRCSLGDSVAASSEMRERASAEVHTLQNTLVLPSC